MANDIETTTSNANNKANPNTQNAQETPTRARTAAATTTNKTRKKTFQTQLQKLPSEIRNITAGGLAGMIAKTFVAPIDRIKLLYQVTDNTIFRLSNIPKAVRSIIENEGFGALWKGNTVTLLRVFPYAGLQFMSFDKCKSYILVRKEGSSSRKDKGLTPMESLLAGSIAGAISVTCTYPLDLARAQLAVLRRNRRPCDNPGLKFILMSNFESRGVAGLFRGVTPSLLGIVPYSGAAFAINEQAKQYIRNVLLREPTTVEKMECGALAGLFAQTFTYPLEVTRRRMQTIGVVSGKIAGVVPENGSSINNQFNSKPTSMIGTMKQLYASQGLKGFFKGVSMNWIKGPIAFSISFTTYDMIKNFMESEEEKDKSFLMSRRDSNIPRNVVVADRNCGAVAPDLK